MAKLFGSLKILVTGSSGFLGNKMVKFLRDRGHSVRETPRAKDLRDYNNILNSTRGIDVVYHFAANMGGIGYFSEQNYYPIIDNFLMDLELLRACERNKVKRVFYPASACAYPTYMMEGALLQEEMLDLQAKPDQMYGWEKLSLIKLIRYTPMDIRVGVLHTIYGEGQVYEGKKAKFPPQMAYKAIQAIKTGKIEVWGDGNQTRTFLHIDDAVEKIYRVMENGEYHGEVNIGSDKEVTINEIVNLCCEVLEIRPEIKHDLTKPVGPTRRPCSNEKFTKYYGEFKEISIKEGFTRLIKYIQNGK